jgi:hypothetical protein
MKETTLDRLSHEPQTSSINPASTNRSQQLKPQQP